MSKYKHDVAIVGAGPGGTATALYLLEAGIKPIIIEKERFPRYHIGESLTGECGACLKRLGLEEQMVAGHYPVKHGVEVFAAGGKSSFLVKVEERGKDGRLQPSSTWQVRRSKFDRMLLDVALERGAEFLPCEATTPLVENDSVTGIRFRSPRGGVEDLKADVLVDASGQATFTANRGLTSRKERGGYDKQVAVFSQVGSASRDPGQAGGNTLLFYRSKNHWAWFIPLDEEVVSIGVVVPADYFNEQRLSKPDFLRAELRRLNPELSKRLPDLNFVEEVRSASNYSYHIKRFTGKGFLALGDSHRFIDPIFSFGLFFAIKEAQYAAGAIERYLAGETGEGANPFSSYQSLVDEGQDLVQDLVDCFWDFPLAFLYFVHQGHREEMVDLFAGRIYGDEATNSEGAKSIRRLLASKDPQRSALPPCQERMTHDAES